MPYLESDRRFEWVQTVPRFRRKIDDVIYMGIEDTAAVCIALDPAPTATALRLIFYVIIAPGSGWKSSSSSQRVSFTSPFCLCTAVRYLPKILQECRALNPASTSLDASKPRIPQGAHTPKITTSKNTILVLNCTNGLYWPPLRLLHGA